MITTVHVSIRWAGNGAPNLSGSPTETLSLTDPRVLLGVQQVLTQRPGVTQPPDLVSTSGTPYFAVSLDERAGTGSVAVTTLLYELTEPVTIRVCFAADGGWKTVLADLAVEVI